MPAITFSLPKTMSSAEIITIGTEILLGEIVDTNSAWLARKLRDLNIDVFRTATVGDNVSRIAEILRETLTRADIIITTGGLGPTVDDPTREAIAQAFGHPLEYQPALWQQIVERMERFGRTPTENQKRQAYIPQGSLALRNPVGTAPAFIVEEGSRCLISLPGVPREMEYLAENEVFPFLRRKYQLRGVIKARVLHTAGMGEAIIDEQIGDLEALTNPTVGLAAHAGAVDVRITAKAESQSEADALIFQLETDLRSRLGKAIFGADEETLAGVVLQQVGSQHKTLTALEANTGGELTRRLAALGQPQHFLGGTLLSSPLSAEELLQRLQQQRQTQGADYALGLAAQPEGTNLQVHLALMTPAQAETQTRGFGGHPKSLAAWGATTLLDLLRRRLLSA